MQATVTLAERQDDGEDRRKQDDERRRQPRKAQALQRIPTVPFGEEGTVRYVSLLVRPDNSVTAARLTGARHISPTSSSR